MDSTVERPTRIASLLLERKRKTNTNKCCSGWNDEESINTYRPSAVGTEKYFYQHESYGGDWNGENFNWQELCLLTLSEPYQHESNLNEISWNVKLWTVDDEKRRRDSVYNKEIADGKVEKRCTRGIKLRYQRERERNFRDGTNWAVKDLLDV